MIQFCLTGGHPSSSGHDWRWNSPRRNSDPACYTRTDIPAAAGTSHTDSVWRSGYRGECTSHIHILSKDQAVGVSASSLGIVCLRWLFLIHFLQSLHAHTQSLINTPKNWFLCTSKSWDFRREKCCYYYEQIETVFVIYLQQIQQGDLTLQDGVHVATVTTETGEVLQIQHNAVVADVQEWPHSIAFVWNWRLCVHVKVSQWEKACWHVHDST